VRGGDNMIFQVRGVGAIPYPLDAVASSATGRRDHSPVQIRAGGRNMSERSFRLDYVVLRAYPPDETGLISSIVRIQSNARSEHFAVVQGTILCMRPQTPSEGV
jgi:hypothetical protein